MAAFRHAFLLVFPTLASLACPRQPGRASAEETPLRAPVVDPRDSSWIPRDRACPPAAPVRRAPERDSRTGRPPTEDERDAALARQVPGGYGGLYLEYNPPPQVGVRARRGTRGVVVLLVDTTQREAALRALAPAVRQQRPDLDVMSARIQPARWTFAELYDWQGVILTPGLRDGVTTIDIDERENRLVFGVIDRAARERLADKLAELELPCFLVGLEIVGRIVPQD